MIKISNARSLLNTIASSSFNKSHAIIGVLCILIGICMYGLYKAKKSGKEEIMQYLFVLIMVFSLTAAILTFELIQTSM